MCFVFILLIQFLFFVPSLLASNIEEEDTLKNFSKPSIKITQEMETYFYRRTQQHIERVKNNMLLMEGYKNLGYETLFERGSLHDKSKLSVPELEGYIWLTWWHYCKKQGINFKYPEGIEELVQEACNHHLKNNLHHPESHKNVDEMEDIDIVEMVCDWTAMSQEYNQKSCLSYVKENIDKWGFSDKTKQDIFLTIEEVNKRLK